MGGFLNLASRPFQNRRPIWRLAVLLWILGASLAATNVALYWGFRSGSVEARTQLRQTRDAFSVEVGKLEEAERLLLGFDLEALNEQVEFLNERIQERTFPWSRLFDELADVLPGELRVTSLTPRTGENETRKRSVERVRPGRWIKLSIEGRAENGEALLELVDNLFEHGAFAAPFLENERRINDGSELGFTITTDYSVEQREGVRFERPVELFAAPDASATVALQPEETP